MTCQDDRHIPSGELIRLEASLMTEDWIERSEFDRVALKLERCEEMAVRLKQERDALKRDCARADEVISGLISERDVARLQAEKAEAEFSARLETIKKDRREWIDRCAKAEAELQNLKLATLAALTQAGIAMLEENPITPSEVKSAIGRLARERDSERARADRYLAAIVEYLDSQDAYNREAARWKDMPRSKVEAAERHVKATHAFLRIVEEVRHG